MNPLCYLFLLYVFFVLFVSSIDIVNLLLHTDSVLGETCIVPSGASSGDDSPAVLATFHKCGQNGRVVFGDSETYNIGKIMNTTELLHCEIDLKGRLLVRSYYS